MENSKQAEAVTERIAETTGIVQEKAKPDGLTIEGLLDRMDAIRKEMVYMSRAANLVKRYGVTVVSPGYRLAWMKPYPAALEDCFAVLKYMNERRAQLGVERIIYTDVAKDGMMQGPNLKEVRTMIQETGMQITGSGGVSCLEDILHLQEAGCEGVILGRALYEGTVDLPLALEKTGGIKR